MIDVCVMRRKTSVEPGNGLKEVEVLAKKMLRSRSRLECFCYCCDDGREENILGWEKLRSYMPTSVRRVSWWKQR